MTRVLDEAALVERLSRSDSSALGELMDLFWRPLRAYASRLLEDEDSAEDVVQGVFVRVWAERSQWQPRSLQAYLFRITRNRALDQLRARLRVGRSQPELASVPPRTPAEILEGDELASVVDRAIQGLPERRREVFTLAYLQGLSYKEIAHVLGITPKTVGNQMTSALAELRTVLEPWLSKPTDRPKPRRGPDVPPRDR